ncbi:Uncharacterized protein DBV15_02698 [Temnothorax longispinosus]|uniref:Uncharacterized protein n=1 Tax=Temnothorax longispinosus TaxID=300112 RepID=A0A4S2K988_9HYME|nr:Uncharacterized protein DBV15_02698 [Temnothorax longispinosus]
MQSEMICDARTCGGCRYLEQDERDDRAASLAEFLANCQHAKCKVVRLVRQQISKLQNMQYERFREASDEAHEKMGNEAKMHEALDNEVQEVYGEVYGPYDDLHVVEGEVEQAFNESHDEPYEMQEAVAVARRTGATNAVEVGKKADSSGFDYSKFLDQSVINKVKLNAATASLRRAASPGRAVDRKWMLRILDRVRHRAHLIMAAAAVGVIVWTALVYGVFLGATACGSGRTCFRSSLKYAHAKRALF